MNIVSDLATGFVRNTGYLMRQIDLVDHRVSLTQHDGANCLNWTVGHIVNYRNVILHLLGANGIEWVDARYDRESEPITADGPDVVAFTELKSLLVLSGEALDAALRACSGEDLERTVPVGDQEVAVGSRIQFYFFHDTLHVGQADVLAAIGR